MSGNCRVICVVCLQELVGRPMYTQLVEGDNGKAQSQDSSTVATVGIKKFLIDVSNISWLISLCYYTSVFCLTLQFYILSPCSDSDSNFLAWTN